MNRKTSRLLLLIIVPALIIVISLLQSINPVFYIPIVFVIFLNRKKIRNFIESIKDDSVSAELKNNDFESVIAEEDATVGLEEELNSFGDVENSFSHEQNTNVSLIEDNNAQQSTNKCDALNSDVDLDCDKKDLPIEQTFLPIIEKNAQSPEYRTVVRKKREYCLPRDYDELLDKSVDSAINRTSSAIKGDQIIEILSQNGIPAQLMNTFIGPRYTRFELKINSGVRLNKIKSLSNDIRLQLGERETFVEAPIPGKSSVGIDVPNVELVYVRLIDVIRDTPLSIRNNKLLFPLGCDSIGQSVFCDLEKAVHLLISGTTGSGKTMCLHSIILSALLKTRPDEVKLVLIDPSKIELALYNDVPHLLWPVIDDTLIAFRSLQELIVFAEERYDTFAEAGVRNINSFNAYVDIHNAELKEGESVLHKLPYIVVIIDQYAEIQNNVGYELENTVQRLTQLGRICGIHVIISTQRPSSDVVTSVIKSSFPSRISFSLPSVVDSKTVLDMSGAECLLGNGDMLYRPQGQISPTRLQGIYVSDSEIKRVTQYVKSQVKPEYEDSYYRFLVNMNRTTIMPGNSANANDMDSLYDEVVEFVKAQQKASTSLLQRRFGIGYNRASRLIDALEDRGVIGPANGPMMREVYLKEDDDE